MATNFPGGLDNFVDPSGSSPLNSPSHSEQHRNTNDSIEAIETKIGVDGSEDSNSIDYKITHTVNSVTTETQRAEAAEAALQQVIAGLSTTAWQADTVYNAEAIVSNGIGLYQAPSGGVEASDTFNAEDWTHLADIALPVGTTSGTIAAGDDSRIVGALPADGGTLTGDMALGNGNMLHLLAIDDPDNGLMHDSTRDGALLYGNKGVRLAAGEDAGVTGLIIDDTGSSTFYNDVSLDSNDLTDVESIFFIDSNWGITADSDDGIIFAVWDGNERMFRFRNSDTEEDVLTVDPSTGNVSILNGQLIANSGSVAKMRMGQKSNSEIVWSYNVDQNQSDAIDDPTAGAWKFSMESGQDYNGVEFQYSPPGGSWDGTSIFILNADGSVDIAGALTLPSDPEEDLEASTKQYVDNNIINNVGMVSPLGFSIPNGLISGHLLGRLISANAVPPSVAPSGAESPIVVVEVRGESGILTHVWEAAGAPAEAIDGLEQNGRIRIYLDDEDTPVVDLSVNDFFMGAEMGDAFTTPVVRRTSRTSSLMNPQAVSAYISSPQSGRDRHLFAPFVGYCRVEYSNKTTSGDQFGAYYMADVVLLDGPIGGFTQTYKVFTNDTLEPTLLSPPSPQGYTPVVAVNPSDIVPQWPLTICDISGYGGQLESFWLAARIPDGNIVPWQEGALEIYIDGADSPQFITTGTEDTFDGSWNTFTVGGFPAGQAGLNFKSNLYFSFYKFFIYESIIFDNELKIIYNPGQRGKNGGSQDSAIGISGFAGVWLDTPPEENYSSIYGLTSGYEDEGIAYADEFVGATGSLVGRRPPDGTDPVGFPGNWTTIFGKTFSLNGSGQATVSLPAIGTSIIDGRSLFQLPIDFGTDYFATARIKNVDATSPAGGSGGVHGVGSGGITNSATSLPVGSSVYVDLGSPTLPNATTVASGATSGGTTATLTSVANIIGQGDLVLFNDTHPELVVVTAVNGNQITFNPTITGFGAGSGGGVSSGVLQYTHSNASAVIIHPWIIEVDPTPGIFGNAELMIVTGTGTAGASPWTVIRGFMPANCGNDGESVNPSAHSAGDPITLLVTAGAHQLAIYPECGIEVRSTSADGIGNQAAIHLQRLSNYVYNIWGGDGYSARMGSTLVNRGQNWNGQYVDVAILAQGDKLTFYYKLPGDVYYQPIASCTPSVGVAANHYVGIYALGNQQVVADSFHIHQLI